MSRNSLLSAVELAPWLVGGGLLGLGLGGRVRLTLAGAAILAATGLWQLAKAHGAVARPGLIRIACHGRWETPLSFVVQHGSQRLLFCRAFDPATGALPDSYWVVALPPPSEEGHGPAGTFEPPADSWLVGRVPARELRFQHHHGDYVDSRSLSAALERVWPTPEPIH